MLASIDLKRLAKKCTLYYFILGIVIGVIMFSYSIVNQEFSWNVLETTYTGLTAGVFALVSMPIIMGLVGLIHAPLLWYLAIFICKKIFIKL